MLSLAGTFRMQGKVDMFWASADLAVRPPSTTHDMDTHTFSGLVSFIVKQAKQGHV